MTERAALRGACCVAMTMLTICVAGCRKSEVAGAGLPHAHSEAMPSIYYDATQSLYVKGRPMMQAGYEDSLKMCRPVHALSAEDVAKLGINRRQYWFENDVRVERDDKPVYVGEPVEGTLTCNYSLKTETTVQWSNGRAAYVVGPTGEVEKQDPFMAASRGPHTVLKESDQSAKEDALTTKALGRGMNAHRVGKDTVMGQPCNVFENSLSGRMCEWAGPHNVGTLLIQSYTGVDTLPLKGEPVDGRGMKITLHAFTVGKALNEADLKAPAGVPAR